MSFCKATSTAQTICKSFPEAGVRVSIKAARLLRREYWRPGAGDKIFGFSATRAQRVSVHNIMWRPGGESQWVKPVEASQPHTWPGAKHAIRNYTILIREFSVSGPLRKIMTGINSDCCNRKVPKARPRFYIKPWPVSNQVRERENS